MYLIICIYILREIIQLRAVYQIAGYIFLYGIFQIPNGAYLNFLVHGLKFSNFEIGMLTAFRHIFTWVGVIVYRYYIFDISLRQIFFYTTILGSVFSLLQILLILQVNLKMGIPNIVFALGMYDFLYVCMYIHY
jgi:hypothetical protein